MTHFEVMEKFACWAWEVLARPALSRADGAQRFVVGAAVMTAGKLLQALGVSWGSIESVGKSQLDVIKAKNDQAVEEAKAKANARRLDLVQEADLQQKQSEAESKAAEARLKHAEAAGKEAEVERARADVDRVRDEAAAARARTQMEAWDRVVAAHSKIVQGGGSVLFSEESLRAVIAFAEEVEPEVLLIVRTYLASIGVPVPKRLATKPPSKARAKKVKGGKEPGNEQLDTLEEVERRHLRRVLEHVGGDRARAARQLGIDVSTLLEKVRSLGI